MSRCNDNLKILYVTYVYANIPDTARTIAVSSIYFTFADDQGTFNIFKWE